jgi:hypothetical protein
MRAAIDVGVQVLERAPRRHVDDDAGRVPDIPLGGLDVGGVAAFVLQTPHETVRGIGLGVDLVEGGDEVGEPGAVQ